MAEVDDGIGLDRLRVLHVNDAAAPLGSNRDRHANVGEGEIGDGLAVFLAHPAFQGLPALLEVPGPDGHGADAAEVQKLRDLHAAGTAARKPSRGRGQREIRFESAQVTDCHFLRFERYESTASSAAATAARPIVR